MEDGRAGRRGTPWIQAGRGRPGANGTRSRYRRGDRSGTRGIAFPWHRDPPDARPPGEQTTPIA